MEEHTDRAEILDLRARLAVTERVAWIGMELAAMLRPEQTLKFIERERRALAQTYADGTLDGPALSTADRETLAAKVDVKFEALVREVREAGGIA